MLGAFVLTHISLLHARMVAHMQDFSFVFNSHIVHTRKLFWSLPMIAPLWLVITIIEFSNT